MLDDFKTELKRLNVKRMRKEELRRQSFALVDDLTSKDGDDHQMEFTDVLNSRPHDNMRFQTMATLDNSSPDHSPAGRRFRQDSVTESRTTEKELIGKSGKKISKLPYLKDFSFNTGGRKKAKVEDPERATRRPDDSPTPHSPTQPPASERLADMRRSLGVIDYHNR
jgi:hypothetical protein